MTILCLISLSRLAVCSWLVSAVLLPHGRVSRNVGDLVFLCGRSLHQVKHSKTLIVYIFLTAYVQVASAPSAQYTWWESVWKCGWERIWLVSMQAASIASKIKHNDVYHQDINFNCLYLLYYTYNKHCNPSNKVSCLLHLRTQCKQYNTQCVYNWCLHRL